MAEPDRKLRVILIGGSSSVGKSSLAESLADRLGWAWASTDELARHPGRPWKTGSRCVPEHVALHYLSLSAEDLLSDVLRHYRGMWPGIEALIASHATDMSRDRLILEGSALWPESVATLHCEHVAAVWLTADPLLIRSRIHEMSRFERASTREKKMIQKFLARTHLYDARMMDAVRRLARVGVHIEATWSLRKSGSVLLAQLGEASLHHTPGRAQPVR